MAEECLADTKRIVNLILSDPVGFYTLKNGRLVTLAAPGVSLGGRRASVRCSPAVGGSERGDKMLLWTIKIIAEIS